MFNYHDTEDCEDIKDKPSSTRLWRLGCFGNKLKTWTKPEDVPAHYRVDNQLSMRHNKPGGKFLFQLMWKDIQQFWTPEYYILESISDTDRIVQGEIYSTVEGIEFWFSFKQGPLGTVTRSTALYKWNPRTVRYYLQHVMYPLSYETLEELLSRFPKSIIELSIFNKSVGDTPGHNTLFWEVREF